MFWHLRCSQACILGFALTVIVTCASAQRVDIITEFGPKTADHPSPNAAAGGRVNGLAIDPTNNDVLYAASEWGGLFKSTDRGERWQHLASHVPHATWDIAVDPNNNQRLIATSFYDGRVRSRAGINISRDGGRTWTTPSSGRPPRVGWPGGWWCLEPEMFLEPSAMGIAFDPDNKGVVYVGTMCGLAKSVNGGENWRFLHPSPDPISVFNPALPVWDVIVHDGVVDLCGGMGHMRSTDDGQTWTTVTNPANQVPSGRCSIAASPLEKDVLFLVTGTTLRDSIDGGKTWQQSYTYPSRQQGRIPFVATYKGWNPKTSQQGFLLWLGDVTLHLSECEGPPKRGRRCRDKWRGQTAAGRPPEDLSHARGAHHDMGQIVFESKPLDACPVALSTDGGVYYNKATKYPECLFGIRWIEPIKVPQAAWNYDMVGVRRPGAEKEDIYYGNQDSGLFGTTTAGKRNPEWRAQEGADGHDVAADARNVISTVCCGVDAGGNMTSGLIFSRPGMTTRRGEIKLPTGITGGDIRRFEQLDALKSFGPDSFVFLTYKGVFVTRNIGLSPTWTQLGDPKGRGQPSDLCGVQIARGTPGGAPIFFAKLGQGPHDVAVCDGKKNSDLYLHDGIGASGKWHLVDTDRGVGIFAVNPRNPNDIIISEIRDRYEEDLWIDPTKPVITNYAKRELEDIRDDIKKMNNDATWTITIAGDPKLTSLVRTWLKDNAGVPLGQMFEAPKREPHKWAAGTVYVRVAGRAIMKRTRDGGKTWQEMPELTQVMHGNGRFRSVPSLGPAKYTELEPYPQPMMVAFDPDNPKFLVAGAANAGLFVSRDDGRTWRVLTDPLNPGGSGVPHIPRPRYIHFDHYANDKLRLYIGTQGRGQWRIDLSNLSGKPKPVTRTVLSGVMFATDSHRIVGRAASGALRRIAASIRARTNPQVIIEGHTDNTGEKPHNQTLSENRADAVRDWLRDNGGVPEAIMTTRGFGDSLPVGSNLTRAGRRKNRRVEVLVISRP